MAMCDTGSSFAQWADGLYTYGPSNPAGSPSLGHASDHSTSPPTLSGSDGSPARPATAAAQQQQQQQAGGLPMSKTIKKKRPSTRASRRAPVTLLNTDAANFRAMVQQFTGIPSGPYGPPGANGPVISFGSGADYSIGGGALPVRPAPTSAVMSFDHHHHLGRGHLAAAPPPPSSSSPAPAGLQGQLFRPQQHQQYGGGGDYGMHHGGGDMFLQGFESSAEDRMLLQSIQAAHQMMPRPASANNTNGYNFG